MYSPESTEVLIDRDADWADNARSIRLAQSLSMTQRRLSRTALSTSLLFCSAEKGIAHQPSACVSRSLRLVTWLAAEGVFHGTVR
jgi:hypothetical protein